MNAHATASPTVVLVALGSNLGNSVASVRGAFGRLDRWSASPVARSSLWDTTPVDCPAGSPRFVNAAARLEVPAGMSPRSLLAALQSIEIEFGRRTKAVMNEARPLDLDLIAWGSLRLDTVDLVLPHPRAHLRRFVLAPLSEVAPDFVLPGQTSTIRGLLEVLVSDERVVRIAVAV